MMSLSSLVFAPRAQAFEVPSLAGPVMDMAGLLPAGSAQQISENLFQFKSKTGVQIQVLILKSLEDQPIENVAIKVFDQWKLGDQKKDNGILFLIAPTERKLRIEVGQGLEGSVPDIYAKRVISDVVAPLFKSGQFDLGIQSGIAALQNYIVTGDEGLLAPESKQKGKIPSAYLLFGFIGLFFIIFLFSPSLAMQILFALLSGGRGGDGSGGSGGWSGGGGSSSGGGASGDW
jgi:uncharacterized protein